MKVGESVPVSKLPTTNSALTSLNLDAPSIEAGVARHFLFCGTRIIRARRPQDLESDEAAALAMVVRTGFNTTKGALIRSMLFPKPSTFKFYRDSFRYISVMAMIAGVGFIASFINFIRLGVSSFAMILLRLLKFDKGCMAHHHCARSRPDHDYCASRTSCNFNDWHEFCTLKVKEEADILH